MEKEKLNKILNVVGTVLVCVIAALLITSILLTCIPHEVVETYYSYSTRNTTYEYYWHNLFYRTTELGVLVVTFAGIALLLTPFIIVLKRKSIISFIHAFFVFGAGGVGIAAGIVNDYYCVTVFGGIEILFGVVFVVLTVLRLVFKVGSTASKNPALKSLEILKKQNLLTEEEYEAKKAQLCKEENETDPNICPNCGRRKHSRDKFCSDCGYKFEIVEVVNDSADSMSTLTKVAQIFFYIGFGLTCATVIGLCWALPMLHIYKRDRDTIGKHSIAFKVCTLLFISEIAGVLMLVDYKH